jgi:hypothetical protein
MRGRIGEARIAVEATPRPQADEDLARATLQCPLQFDGVLTCVEDEQSEAASPSSSRPSKAPTCSAATTLASWGQAGRAARPRGRSRSRG